MLKRMTLAIVIASVFLSVCYAGGGKDKDAAANAGTDTARPVAESSAASPLQDTSYAFGLAVGSDLKQTGLAFDYDAFVQGMSDVMEGKETRMTLDEAVVKMQTAYREMMAEKAEENKAKEEVFLAENGKKPGINTTASGLQYEVVKQASGAKPVATDTVKVHYEGTFLDGEVFDSSRGGEPAEFPLGGVIPGWTEGIQLMSVGSSYKFYVPSALAYGAQGSGGVIPPNATLVFNVELLEIVK